ncbi:cytochrome P450 2C31-like [Uloborus diversus]|uniref:cytochrome P450 2C31-like n=1 Tax=Uloborus diversus TaxID=327109 RepID=UPI0024090B35|nr:cytochrome P450 2C31-like [Uloborus diversus]
MVLDSIPDATKYLLIFAISLLICWIFVQWLKTRNYPPGPTGFPVIGYGMFLGKKPNVRLAELGRKYGDIFSFYTGPQLFICITEYHLAKEILSHPLTLSRPAHVFTFLRGCGGFSGKNGEEWTEQRRFVVQTMRNLGLGKGIWETMIQEDTRDFLNEIRSWNGKPHNIEGPLQVSQAVNNIALLFGRHMSLKEDKDDIEIIQNSSRILLQYFSSVSINMALPGLAKILNALKISSYHKFIKLLREFEAIFSREVEIRMKAEDSLLKEDFIGCYLREMEKRKTDTKPHCFNIDNLLGNLFLLFVAGLDSTLASIAWLLILMAEHQEVQKKVHEEIDSVLGRDGTVYFDDKVKLPYTSATILEMHRWASISPIYPPRYPLHSFEFHGYTIPKGSNIICNGWAIMHDTRYFKNPMEFTPERFLSGDGTKAGKYDGYLPFSTGKRNCPGEGIAMMTTYLYFVSIMQKFKVTPKPGEKVDIDYICGGALLPKPQELCFLER